MADDGMYDAVRACSTITNLLPTFGFDTVLFENDSEDVVCTFHSTYI